ncbi:DUF6351 family protein [Streptacidiphilus sp. N1-12]|uniref:DUF6351 family protein n=2 Tax=Streptacidiphilus alkalitolerans TaxID=3342712 RepID=A0ABV6WQ32_9ACTN
MPQAPRHRPGARTTAALLAAVAAAATLTLSAPHASAAARGAAALSVTTPANPHPQLISGNETLIKVAGRTADLRRARITENGRDITSAFARQPDGSLLGLATALRPGTGIVTATAGRRLSASVRIKDHSINGPVFSGPQQEPYYCETTAFGLAAAARPTCSAPTVTS